MRKVILGSTLFALSFSSNYSFSGSINTTFSVTANVLSTCNTVTATTLAFGDYDSLSGSDKDTTSTISVTCTSGTSFSIKLNGGDNGTISARNLKEDAGTDTLSYGLYTDSSRSTVWGDGVTGSDVTGTGTGSAVTETVYGRISGGQTKNTGSYTDTITVTVDY
jgi:spore coat protein U-like protein